MEKKKVKISIHLILALVLVAIVAFCIYRLAIWNSHSRVVINDVEPGSFDLECLDFYVYPDAEALKNHKDNGVNDILVIGNGYANNFGNKDSVVDLLREKLDANIVDISVDKSTLASTKEVISYGLDSFSLYHLVSSIVSKDYSFQQISAASDCFFGDYEKRYQECMDTLTGIDLDDIDTVLIMYSFVDYFSGVPTMFYDEHHVFGYHGALLSSIELLQENYPHLNIVFVSPCPVYLKDSDGTLKLGTITDFGMGNASTYFEHQYAVATEKCISFVDNYFYKINESNIEEYMDGMNPNKKGTEMVADHIVSFLKNKGSVNY